MTSHQTYREQLLDLAYGELGKREARELRAHLESCADCRAELTRMTATRGAMSALPAEPAPERGEAILLAAAREAARERNRPWLPSWVWGASVGVVGVAAVALVAVRLSGAVRSPAQRDKDALVSSSAQAEEVKPASPAAADSASSNAAAAEPARPAPPPEPEAAPSIAFKAVPAPKGDLAKRKEGTPAVRGDGARLSRSPVGRSSAGDDAGGGLVAEAAPRPAPAAPAAAPQAEERFAQPPPPTAQPMPARPLASEERQDARGRADDADLSALDQKREAAAPAAGPGLAGMKARAAKAASEDAIARYQRLRAAGRLRAASANFRDCPGEASRQVETDEQGRVVKVTRRGAAGGTPYQAEQFYGEDGQLGAVRYSAGGTSREVRLGAPGADAASAGVPASLLEPARAGDAGLDAPSRCVE